VLDIILIPKMGILGAAVGWAISIALRNLLALVQIKLLMGMWPFTRWSAVVATAALGCFAVVPGILTVTDAPGITVIAALAVGAVGYAAFAMKFRGPLQLDNFTRSARGRGRRNSAATTPA